MCSALLSRLQLNKNGLMYVASTRHPVTAECEFKRKVNIKGTPIDVSPDLLGIMRITSAYLARLMSIRANLLPALLARSVDPL